MKLRPRLIPAVIAAATMLLGVKVSDILGFGGHALAQAPSPTSTATGAPVDLTKQANAATPPAAQPTAPSTPPASNDPAANVAPAANANPASGASAPDQSQAAPAPSSDATSTDQTANASATTAAAQAPLKDPLLLSPAEIEILQQLSQRRAELDKRASDLDQQQVVLQAAEKRVDDKIAKLQDLQKSIQTAVGNQNAAEDARMQSLVKIYETMKPTDAAQILGQMDMPILLQLLGHMKEAKTAPILAAMDPAKAQAITAAMAQKSQTAQAMPAAATGQ